MFKLESLSSQALLSKIKRHRLLFATVVVPTFVSVLYYGCIASDVYISESQFVVRSSKQQASMGLGLFFGSSFSSASNESHSVSAFMLSRDALKDLSQDLNYQERYTDSSIDFLSRFGALSWNKSFESLHRYYQGHVSIYFDPTTAISILKVSAYRAEDAQKINEKLLELAEKHINFLNDRSKQDMIRFAQAELQHAEKAATEATAAITNYRSKNTVFNPAEFEKLSVEKGFTLEQLKIRRAALESAITDAMRQMLYLERVVRPNNPDYAAEPHRLKNIFSTFVVGLILWGVLSMLVAGIREHHD